LIYIQAVGLLSKIALLSPHYIYITQA